MYQFIEIYDEKIHYFDSDSGGKNAKPIILFIHGNSFSLEVFKMQLSSMRLLKNFRLIALDLPGHGKSSFMVTPFNYSLPGFGKCLIEFINKLELSNIFFCGHSLGGHILFEILPELETSKTLGSLTWGTPPFGKLEDLSQAFYSTEVTALLSKETLTENDGQLFAACCHSENYKNKLDFVETILAADPRLRTYLSKSLVELRFSNEIHNINKSNLHIGIINLHDDLFVQSSYFQSNSFLMGISRNRKCQIINVPNAGHSFHLESPEIFEDILLGIIKTSLGEMHISTGSTFSL